MKQYLINFSNLLLTVMLKVTCMMGNRTVVAVQTPKFNHRQQDHYYTLCINFIMTILLCCANVSDQPYILYTAINICYWHCDMYLYHNSCFTQLYKSVKQTKYSKYLLLTCMKYLYHTSYSTPLYRSVNTGHIQYVAVNICYWHVWHVCTTPVFSRCCTDLWKRIVCDE